MKRDLIAAVDAGTTGVKCCLFDIEGNLVSSGYREIPSVYPRPGYVEKNAEEVISCTFRAAREALSGVDASRVACLCVTGMRNTFVPVDREGNFLSNMFIWQDQRGIEVHPWILERLAAAGLDKADFYRKNGQPFGVFQAGFKALWLRHLRPELYEKAWKLVTPVAFLARAFGAEEYLEENNDLGCWLLADADSQKIDPALCEIFDMDPDKFPRAFPPGTRAGSVSPEAAEASGFLPGTPLYIASGDQQCGALGVGNFGTPDLASVCMGTAGLVIAYSPEPIRHPSGLCQVQGHPAGGYTIEAHSSSCMSSYQWARKLFLSDESLLNESRSDNGIGGNLNETQPDESQNGNRKATRKELDREAMRLASEAPIGARGVIFLPWLQGAACPWYDDNARGAWVGMSLASGKPEMLRASMEGICFETRLMLDTLRQAPLPPIRRLRLLGGASYSDFWNQMQADIYGLPVETVSTPEATALGVAIIGAVGAGIWPGYPEAVSAMIHPRGRWEPKQENVEKYNRVYALWQSCYDDLRRSTFPGINTIV